MISLNTVIAVTCNSLSCYSRSMSFYEEPTGYVKTVLSDLQGSWQNLRRIVVEHGPFPECQRLLFHIDEAMSWECVRDLDAMRRTLLLIINIATQAKAPNEIMEWIKDVHILLDETIAAVKSGRVK